MVRKLIDLLLIVAIVVGGVLAWRVDRERGRLRAEADRLSRKAGDLTIGDPNRAHVAPLETGAPLHFAWRVYMPANVKEMMRHPSGSSSSSGGSEAREFIARVRLREGEQGNLEVYSRFGGGSSRSGIGSPKLADRLRGRWDEVEVEQLGRGDVVAIDPDEPTMLLRLTLPDDLRDEAQDLPLSNDPDDPEPVLYELELRYSSLGPPTGRGPSISYSSTVTTSP